MQENLRFKQQVDSVSGNDENVTYRDIPYLCNNETTVGYLRNPGSHKT